MRRTLAALAAVLATSTTSAAEQERIVERIDHLVFAVADLEEGIKQIEAITGVRAQFGGAHPGVGSHNALLSLGPRVYLEILAPDPKQAKPRSLESLGLSETRSSRLVAWAVGSSDLEQLVKKANAHGAPLKAPESGGRKQPDGAMLSWRTAELPSGRDGDGVAPFFIDWGATVHPATTSPKGLRLAGFRALHPSPPAVQPLFDALEIPLTVETGAEIGFIAVLDTPRGPVELK